MARILTIRLNLDHTRVEVRDTSTNLLVASGEAPHAMHVNGASVESDPNDWWTSYEAALAAAGSPSFDSFVVDAQPQALVMLDARGEVIRPAKLSTDTESAPDAKWCISKLGVEKWIELVGFVPTAANTVTKMSLIHRSEPENWAKMAHALLPHDWMVWKLNGCPAGKFVTTPSVASETGYWSAKTGAYCDEILSLVDKDRDWSGVLPSLR